MDEQISMKVKKANEIAGLIRRTFSYLYGPQFIDYLRKTTSSIWTSNMDTTFEKIYNYFGKCKTPSNKIGGWFSSHELLRKAKKTESNIAVLQESSRRHDRDFQTFPLLRQLYAT